MTTDRAVMQQAEIAIANLLSYQSTGNTPTIHEYGHARRTLGAMRQALAQPVNADEQAVFEDWLHRKCPSGDVTEVQRQWVASSEYADYLEQALAQPVPDVAAMKQERDELRFQRDLSRELMREQALRIAELEQGQDALAEYANPQNWSEDYEGVKREWLEPDGSPRSGYNGFELAQKAIAAMGPQPAPTSGKLEPVLPADSKMIAAPAVVEPVCQCTEYEFCEYHTAQRRAKQVAAAKGAQP